MTHAVVPADIQVAKGLIDAGCEDSGIVAVLCWRGVEAAKAATLVQQLRHGGQVELEARFKPATPRPASRQAHKRTRRSESSRRSRATAPKMCDASTEPLYFLYDHRPRWRRILRRTVRWTLAGIATFVVLCCFCYVVYKSWCGAQQNAAEFESHNRNLTERQSRIDHGLPDLPSDDLKVLPPAK